MDRYEAFGESPEIGLSNSDKELIRYGHDIDRLSQVVASQGGAPIGTTGVEFAYLRDRVASIPATSLAGAAVKLRGLIAGRPRGLRLGDTELALLRNVLEVVENAAGIQPLPVAPAVSIADPALQSDPAIESLLAEFFATAARHRALIARNLALRTEAGMSVARTQALRLNLDSLSTALSANAVEDPISEAKFLACSGIGMHAAAAGQCRPAPISIRSI